jgi:hypothetical protein
MARMSRFARTKVNPEFPKSILPIVLFARWVTTLNTELMVNTFIVIVVGAPTETTC